MTDSLITHPPYSPEEKRSRETFLALMWALSYPGRPQALPSVTHADSFAAVAETLLDLETSYFTPDTSLAEYVARTGARALPSEQAAYHFYPVLDEAALTLIEAASIGTLLQPDQAATLVIGCALAAPAPLRWYGPGINGESVVSVGALPQAFWDLRTRRVRYPLGWDVFFIDGQTVIGLPRAVTVEGEPLE